MKSPSDFYFHLLSVWSRAAILQEDGLDLDAFKVYGHAGQTEE